ncbi:MAG: T9SS type A sorting domain-containing protein [Taibaiella sp.]|nr:T9SS type A sorting domain-containing protein [Taibaiella sp.]
MRTFTLLLAFTATVCAERVQAQYCMLPGRTIYSNDQPGILNFKLKNINRTSSNVEKPLNQPSLVVTTDSTVLERGKTYPVSIMHSKDNVIFPNARNNIRVWIDYNGDKDFEDAGETVITKDYEYAGTYTDSFTVPATAKLGVTRLRATAKMSSDAGHTIPTSCDMPADPIDYHGEMEDYTVTIIAPSDVNTMTAMENKVSVAPNPSMGLISVSFSRVSSEALNVTLYDMTGKKVATLLTDDRQDKHEYVFDLHQYNLQTGMYMMQVSNGTSVSYQRIAMVN